MKKQVLSRWKYIVIYDDSKKEISKYELNDDERLKNKMKRNKKRSLMGPLIKPIEINQACLKPIPKKYEITSQCIFSYNQELPTFINVMPPFTIPLSESKNCQTIEKLSSISIDIQPNPEIHQNVGKKPEIKFITKI